MSETKRIELAAQVASNARRLSSLLGHLLDLSKFVAGKMLLDLQKIDLSKAIEEMIDEAKTLYINDKQLNIKCYSSQKRLYCGRLRTNNTSVA